jgi:hypothetical protein
MPGNIVQLEFFLHRARDIAGIYAEALARAKDGARIKLAVRIVDADGEIAAQAMEAVAGKDAFEDYIQYEYRELRAAWFWRRWRMARRRRMLGRKCAQARARLVGTALDKLGHAAHDGGSIAVEEDACAPLRLARDDELHELLEAARRSRDAWVFVFEPNDILADSNKLLYWVR